MSTDARTEAISYYAQSARNLADDMKALHENPEGVVVWLPQLVVMMKPARRDSPEGWEDLSTTQPGADGWYVHLLTGEVALARELGLLLPELPWLLFQRGQRDEKIHCRSWCRVVRSVPPIRV